MKKNACISAVPPGALLNGGTGSERGGHKCPQTNSPPILPGSPGTFVMYDPAGDKYIVYNEPQSKKTVVPCSTFKIYNSLIGTETGVLDQEDVYTLFKWNGTQYSFPYWNHDLRHRPPGSRWCGTSRSSPRASARNGWEYIDKIGYGNKDISGGLTTFWLGSSLPDFRAGAGRPAQQAIFGATARSQPRIPRFCKRTSLFPRTAAPS